MGVNIESKTAKFVPRLSAPSEGEKFWIHNSKGGVNECILISGKSVLPNCVGYAWGRAYECWGVKPKLSKGNAENWYLDTADGYVRSATPAVGAVVCWRKGNVYNEKDGCGHVAFVEKVESNGDIVCSNSAYGGSRFYMQTYRKSAGYNSGTLVFQGFILPPVRFDSVIGTSDVPLTDNNIKVGDIVEFVGSRHYSSASAVSGVKCKGGKAKVTSISKNSLHPYHVVNCGNGCTVYGWVDGVDIKNPAADIALKVGDKVKIKSGAKDYNGKVLASFVHANTYSVMEISGDRVVVGIGKAVTAAVKSKDLSKV